MTAADLEAIADEEAALAEWRQWVQTLGFTDEP